MDHTQGPDPTTELAQLTFKLGQFAADLLLNRESDTVSRRHVALTIGNLIRGHDYPGSPPAPAVPALWKVNYTPHGHPYPSSVQGAKPQLVAKCGGPALCSDCGSHAGWGRQADGTNITPIEPQLQVLHGKERPGP